MTRVGRRVIKSCAKLLKVFKSRQRKIVIGPPCASVDNYVFGVVCLKRSARASRNDSFYGNSEVYNSNADMAFESRF